MLKVQGLCDKVKVALKTIPVAQFGPRGVARQVLDFLSVGFATARRADEL
jgi:hypothetical protein